MNNQIGLSKGVWFVFFLLLFFSSNEVLAQSSFHFQNFETKEGLHLTGDAHLMNGALRLTRSEAWQRGAAWYIKEQIPVTDGFTIDFTFRFSRNRGSGNGADGIALVLCGVGNPVELGEAGEGIGYDGIPNSIAIEFDSFDNGEGSDNHVSIHSRGRFANSADNDYSLGINHRIPTLKDEEIHYVQIVYQDHQIAVYLDDMANPVLENRLKIHQLLNLKNGRLWLGFTSATGGGMANHDILSWAFRSETPVTTDQISPPKPPMEEPSTPDQEDREIVPTKTIEVYSSNIKIKVWDNDQVDGDIISLKINDKWLVRRQKLRKKANTYRIRLEEKGTHYLVLYAHNLGKIPPNTASILVLDKRNKKRVTLRSDMDKSEAIRLIFKPD